MALKKITDSAVERMAMKSELRCSELKGFGVRATVNVKTFFVMYSIPGGKRRRKTLGTFPVTDVSTARARALEILGTVEGGDDPVQVEKQETLAGTIRSLFTSYMESPDFTKLSEKWQDYVRHNIRSIILPAIGERPTNEVTRGELVILLESALERGNTTANHSKRIVSKVFNWAIDRELIATNPAYRLPMPAKIVKRDRVLTNDELVDVWQACDQEAGIAHRLYQLMIATGQRPGELKTLRWDDVDGDWIVLRDTKNGTTQRAYLGEKGKAVLELAANDSDWVFPAGRSDAVEEHLTNHTTAWRRLRSKLGMEDATAYDLRRSMATSVAKAGAGMDVVSRILNHTPQGVTSVYQRYGYEAEVQAAVDSWHRKLDNLLDGEEADVVYLSVRKG